MIFSSTVEIKDHNEMFDWQNVFDQPVAFDRIQKNATCQGYDYIPGSLLDYNYFKEYYKMIAIDLSKNKKHVKLIQKQYKKLILQKV